MKAGRQVRTGKRDIVSDFSLLCLKNVELMKGVNIAVKISNEFSNKVVLDG